MIMILLPIIVLAVTIICQLHDRSEEKKDQRHREDILCRVDEHRMAEIKKLKDEIERLKHQ